MEALREAVRHCPIIDNHAHNLLLPAELDRRSLLSATSEASGPALLHAKSTLAHLRAVKQLSRILSCEPTWEAVERRVEEERRKPDDVWAKRCFEGIATVLIDDGLDPKYVHPYAWHDRLVPYACRRIVRIEVVAQDIMISVRKAGLQNPGDNICSRFRSAIYAALKDDAVAGFKSVICYRTGLAVPSLSEVGASNPRKVLDELIDKSSIDSLQRLEHELLGPFFIHYTIKMMKALNIFKPFQFHTGLGDNDIQLSKASAALLQPLIKEYSEVPFVLLHASYPFTQEAGYLATVYENCYLDIGEVFIMVSQNGQERVIREALELCPTNKLCWSTDGHWLPETYLLAVIQIREGLEKVLVEYVRDGALTVKQAITCVQDLLYNTSWKLYKLDLPQLDTTNGGRALLMQFNDDPTRVDESSLFRRFHQRHPDVRYFHLQYIDYTTTRRGRMVPFERMEHILETKEYVGIQRGILRQLQNDTMAPGTVHQGEWCLKPCLESIRPTSDPTIASVQCEISFKDGNLLSHDPRTILRRTLERAEADLGLKFTAGFEIEVVFMQPAFDPHTGNTSYVVADLAPGHAWSSASALETVRATSLLRDILQALEQCEIKLEQYHAEGAKSQYELILAPLPALTAADTVIAARTAIAAVADKHGLRATLVPRAYDAGFGTGAHVHLSMEPETKHESFYAGVLRHMCGLLALAMSQPMSYERQGDGKWSGGSLVCWGWENRECCLRRILRSHWECKVVDGFANVYLVLAAIIGAGVQGIKDEETLYGGSVDKEPSDLTEKERAEMDITERLPNNLNAALEAMQADKLIVEVLGEEAVRSFVDVKTAELKRQEGMSAEEARNWYIERY